MKKTVEELVMQFTRNNEEIAKGMTDLQKLLEENNRLATELRGFSEDDKDYISLAKASQKYGITYATLYKRVRKGDIKNYSSSNLIIVKGSEVERVMFRRFA